MTKLAQQQFQLVRGDLGLQQRGGQDIGGGRDVRGDLGCGRRQIAQDDL
jgi:hypothetical protein